MNQTCKVCGEPAAGFHFGAFTCEGCKSFFGRSYNSTTSVSDCKNNGECVINKKNRTACKACRLRKCYLVGMSKSGSRYGRRSNWFKIHCLLQEQQQQQQATINSMQQNMRTSQKTPPLPPQHLNDYKTTASPAVSSPESHNSDSSIEISDARRIPMFPGLIPPSFLPPAGLLNNNPGVEAFNKRVFLDAVLQSQRSPTPEEVVTRVPINSPHQESPIDLSMKTLSERGSSPAQSDRSTSVATERGNGSEADEESDCDSEKELKQLNMLRPTPLDLTTKV
ncbi:hypothetical protein NQ317_008076 [Molorchus minor]|uniref:Nuclear receptor domain-containing protein n=1 Tax=Molorchus minor TaxID=1323400 RepID=A0ABQ9J2V2_9CUCU|nr:hypothetical protein NQ317_008076 [Molorchus minor]